MTRSRPAAPSPPPEAGPVPFSASAAMPDGRGVVVGSGVAPEVGVDSLGEGVAPGEGVGVGLGVGAAVAEGGRVVVGATGMGVADAPGLGDPLLDDDGGQVRGKQKVAVARGGVDAASALAPRAGTVRLATRTAATTKTAAAAPRFAARLTRPSR